MKPRIVRSDLHQMKTQLHAFLDQFISTLVPVTTIMGFYVHDRLYCVLHINPFHPGHERDAS